MGGAFGLRELDVRQGERRQNHMSQPIRVAQVIRRMNGYGVSNYVLNYYRYIDRDKIQFDFIAHDDFTEIPYEEIERMGGRVFLVPSYVHPVKYIAALMHIFRENRYSIVHSHVNTRSVFSLFAAARAGVPIRIAHNHTTAAGGEWIKNVINYTLRLFIKVNATHYAAASRYSAAWLFGRRTVERGRAEIFHPVVEPEKYIYDGDVRLRVRQELDLEGRFVLGHVGRFCYQKNHEFLLDIFQAVRKRRPDALLLLIGDGETMDAVRRKAERLGLSGDVRMLGVRNDVRQLYQAMDVFVLPSWYEGLPTVAVEAQVAGLKVVTSTRVTQETKVRSDMAFLDLSAGAERWAEEVLKANPDARSFEGDFSSFDVSVQAKRLERFYCGLLRS